MVRGGYRVQPLPAPAPTNIDTSKKITDGIRSQKEKLLSRGKLMSGHPKSTGSIQLPNPPIKIGITEKKIIISA